STGILRDIVFDHPRFEANNGNDTTKYHFVAGDSTSNGFVNPILRDPFFGIGASTAKGIHMDGAAVQGFIIDNFCSDSPVSNSIKVENDAFGVMPNWERKPSMTFNTVVSDAGNRVECDGEWRDWTPTITDSASTGVGTPTITTKRYEHGKG